MRERSPGVWELRVYVGRDPANPTRKVWKSKTFRGGERDATKALARLTVEVDDTRPRTLRDTQTVAELVDRYITTRSAEWSPATTRDARHLARNHLARIGTTPADKLRPLDVETFLSSLAEHPATARNARSLLRAAYEDAVRLELVDRNPARTARVPAAPKRQVTAPTLQQVAPVIAAALTDGDVGMATLIRLAAVTGARRGELVALRWRHVGFDDASVTFEDAVVSDGGVLTVKDTKTGAVKRVAVDAVTVAALKAWRIVCAENGLKVRHRIGPGSFVWSQDFAGRAPWWPDTVTHRWRRLADANGLVAVRFHDLRHAMVSTLIEAGYDPVVAAARAGHSSPVVTLGTYAHAQPARDRDAALHLAAVLDGTT